MRSVSTCSSTAGRARRARVDAQTQRVRRDRVRERLGCPAAFIDGRRTYVLAAWYMINVQYSDALVSRTKIPRSSTNWDHEARPPRNIVKDTLKKIALRLLPRRILEVAKRRHYLLALKEFDESDEKDLSIVKKLVRPGDYVVDVGANIGWYTKVLSELVGDSGRVFSFEPVPPTYSLLCHAVEALALRNVSSFQIGISNTDAVVDMEVPPYTGGGENFYMARIVDKSAALSSDPMTVYSVRVGALNSLLADFRNRIAFIKCDVEGHEWPAVEGARDIISCSHPAMLIEVSGDPDSDSSDAKKLFNLLRQEGYEVYWYDGSQLSKREPKQISVNYFFLMPEHLARLTTQG